MSMENTEYSPLRGCLELPRLIIPSKHLFLPSCTLGPLIALLLNLWPNIGQILP